MRTVQTIAVIAGLLVSLGASPRNAIEPLPRDLEIQLALSALPPHLRDAATVYVLNPARGFEVARPGTNGFHAFVARTGDGTSRCRLHVVSGAADLCQSGRQRHRPDCERAARHVLRAQRVQPRHRRGATQTRQLVPIRDTPWTPWIQHPVSRRDGNGSSEPGVWRHARTTVQRQASVVSADQQPHIQWEVTIKPHRDFACGAFSFVATLKPALGMEDLGAKVRELRRAL